METTITRHVPPQHLIDLINPVVRAALRSRAHAPLDDALLILHVTGRRSGRTLDIPVTYHRFGDELLVVTQHTWRANLRGGAEVQVTLQGRCRTMHAEVDEDPRSVAATILELVRRDGLHATQRLVGLTFHPEQVPEPAELEGAVRRFDLAFVRLTSCR
ncbi:nitroreductase/quinone reductase family protein [Spongisporangium articulatum]|uniref:Nitroreductase/quinone reductase family protein n=1 Tax=Spongisporangium articulatum TaxID=3362603 RepID=A0ABW8ALW0_9ACTN